MRHQRWMRNQSLHASKAFRERANAYVIQQFLRRLERPQIKRKHSAVSTLLALGDFVLRVRRQPRINHAFHFRMRLQKFRHRHPVRVVTVHSHRQRLDSARNKEAIHRRKPCSGRPLNEINLLGISRTSENRSPTRAIAVPIQIFRHRMDHNVGAKLNRSLKVGAEKVLSTTNVRFRALHTRPTAARSVTIMVGFVGVST